jgi:putative endonuclease
MSGEIFYNTEMKTYYIYIMSSESGVIYIGMTNNLERRVYEHKKGVTDGFSNKYKCTKLIYFELTNDVESALNREKQLKKWRREKKEHLINTMNPSGKISQRSLP